VHFNANLRCFSVFFALLLFVYIPEKAVMHDVGSKCLHIKRVPVKLAPARTSSNQNGPGKVELNAVCLPAMRFNKIGCHAYACNTHYGYCAVYNALTRRLTLGVREGHDLHQ